jgi:peptide deformylase
MIKEIIKMGNPILREQSKILSAEEIKSALTTNLKQDMLDTMNDLGGIGIAAPQIGINKQICLINLEDDNERYPDIDSKFITTLWIINPKITVLDSTTQSFWEGCLSVPGLRGYVPRPSKIKLNFLDEEANEQELVAEDFLATVIQHELDHLFGKIYIDHITDKTKIIFEDQFHFYEEEEFEEFEDDNQDLENLDDSE